MMKTQCKTRGGVLLIALLLAAALGLSTVGFLSAKADGGVTYDLETGTTTVDAATANSNTYTKLLDYWHDSTITYTDNGVQSRPSAAGKNPFSIMGIYSLEGDGLTLEVNFPLYTSAGEYVVAPTDSSKSQRNCAIALCSTMNGDMNSISMARLTIWGNTYNKNNNFVNSTLRIGDKEVASIPLPRYVLEEGGEPVKIGFNLHDGWCVDTIDKTTGVVTYNTNPTNSNTDYMAKLQAVTIKETPRVQILKGNYSNDPSWLMNANLYSINGQSLSLQDGKLTIQDGFFTASELYNENKYFIIDQEYLFELVSTESSNDLTKSKLNPNASIWMRLFLENAGNAWGTADSKRIFVTVTDPKNQKTTKEYFHTFGKADQTNISFTPTMCGSHTIEYKILTDNQFIITRSIDVFVEPNTVVTEGNVTVSDGTITLPTAKAGDANGNTVDEGTVTVTAKCNNEAVTVTDGKIVDAQAGVYAAVYKATVHAIEYTKAIEFYYDGTQIITDDIAVTTELSSDMILTDDKIAGIGGTVGTVVTVKFGEQAAVTAPVTADGWETTLTAVDAATAGDLVITYGRQRITYTGVRRGVTYTVTATAGAHGSATADVAFVKHGGTVTFTVTADEGYRVATVKLGDETKTLTEGCLVVENVTENLTLTVTFEEIPQPVFYTVTVADAIHGRVTASVASIEQGGTVTFTVTADSGYTVDTVKLNGVDKTLTEGRLVVENVAADLTLAVTFKAVESTEPYAPESGCGCNGTVGGVSAALALLSLLGAAVVAKKRK